MNDEILKLLQFIHDNEDKVIKEPPQYANLLVFAFSQKYYDHLNLKELFPEMRLHVERINPDVVSQNIDLFNYFFKKLTSRDNRDFQDVWITTSFVSDRDLLLVELSFE